MRIPATRWWVPLAIGGLSIGGHARAESPVCISSGESSRDLAAPVVSGAFGPWPHVVVAVTRPVGRDRATFDVRVRSGAGPCDRLAGPEDPNELFLFQVARVALVPLRKRSGNALVVLYTVRQIGPGRPTEHLALVFDVTRTGMGPVRTTRRQVEQVTTVAQVQRRLERR